MKVIELYKRFIFGDDTTFDFQKRIFLLITHLSIIIGIIGIVVDIVLDLASFPNLCNSLNSFSAGIISH